MIDRNKAVIGTFAILAALSAIGFALMLGQLGRDACLDGTGAGASCPALAVVNGMRYGVGNSTQLVDAEAALTPYGDIERTNVPVHFAEMTAYSLSGVDPALVLVARSSATPDAAGPYRLMFVIGSGDSDAAWPAICRYLPEDDQAADDRCVE